jgi:UDP-N-acetylglucosamine 2-epimerase (non-hydrolysing)
MTTTLTFILGTRPEMIKLSPLIREADERGIDSRLVHTGQHYSEELNDVFFETLGLPRPATNLGVGSSSHGRQTGEMLSGIEREIEQTQPDVVIAQGDTNSVLATAIAAGKLDTEFAHVEAGLRSDDRAMPEEQNRIVADHLADYLFAPTDTAAARAEAEGIAADRVHITGNTIVDAVQQNVEFARTESTALRDNNLEPGEYVLLTAHRAANVDDQRRFADILRGVAAVGEEIDCPVVYPIHPRAAERLDEFGMAVPDNVRLIDSLDFLEFLYLESSARLVVTDSGGVQEETCILQVPCVTVRDSTERGETVDVGANVVAGTEPEAITDAANEMLGRATDWNNPFGDGRAAVRILDTLDV